MHSWKPKTLKSLNTRRRGALLEPKASPGAAGEATAPSMFDACKTISVTVRILCFSEFRCGVKRCNYTGEPSQSILPFVAGSLQNL